MHKKAVLLSIRSVDGYWLARYIGEPAYTSTVVLQPKLIHLADE